MGMNDVDVSMGDNNQTHTLREAYGYDKIEIPFENMEALKACEYLGAGPQSVIAKA